MALEVIKMDRKETLHMLAHYTGNYMLRSRRPIEEGDLERADSQRIELLSKLEKLEQIPEVVSCIKYFTEARWRSHEGVDAFNSFYAEINPNVKDHKDLIKKLFGH